MQTATSKPVCPRCFRVCTSEAEMQCCILDHLDADIAQARAPRPPLVGGGQGRPDYDPGCADESDRTTLAEVVTTIIVMVAMLLSCFVLGVKLFGW